MNNKLGIIIAIAATVALAAPALADELWLAPGKSVTLFDAADPSPAAATPAAPLSSRERTLISKPGATSAQAERDIQQCRSYAERAAAQFLSSSARVAAYNIAMQSCLRSFGYTIHTPAA